MRRAGLAFAAAIMAAGTLTACGGGNDEFCDAGDDFDASSMSSPDKVQDTLDEMADSAPDDIKDDVENLRDGIEESQDDPANADTEGLMESAQNIQDWGNENCE